MAVIFNMTFVVAPSVEDDFLAWLRNEAWPRLFPVGYEPLRPKAMRLREVGGEPVSPEDGLSIAVQAQFAEPGESYLWNDSHFVPVAQDFMQKFGSHAAVFTTLLEEIPGGRVVPNPPSA